MSCTTENQDGQVYLAVFQEELQELGWVGRELQHTEGSYDLTQSFPFYRRRHNRSPCDKATGAAF